MRKGWETSSSSCLVQMCKDVESSSTDPWLYNQRWGPFIDSQNSHVVLRRGTNWVLHLSLKTKFTSIRVYTARSFFFLGLSEISQRSEKYLKRKKSVPDFNPPPDARVLNKMAFTYHTIRKYLQIVEENLMPVCTVRSETRSLCWGLNTFWSEFSNNMILISINN